MSEMKVLNFREIAEEEIKRAISNLVIQKHGYWAYSENDDMFTARIVKKEVCAMFIRTVIGAVRSWMERR